MAGFVSCIFENHLVLSIMSEHVSMWKYFWKLLKVLWKSKLSYFIENSVITFFVVLIWNEIFWLRKVYRCFKRLHILICIHSSIVWSSINYSYAKKSNKILEIERVWIVPFYHSRFFLTTKVCEKVFRMTLIAILSD